jgi:two-component system cell cycle response regulator
MRLTHARFDDRPAPRPSPRPWVYVAVVTLLAFIFWLDGVTESAPLQHLYYLPIILASQQMGTVEGVGTSIAAIVLYHLANPALLTHHYKESDIVQISLFLAAGIVTARLADDARRLHQLAATDDLTGLHNLRSFESQLAAMIRAARADGGPLAMLVLDVDRLKSINDVHGHLAGAEAVRIVGRVLAHGLPNGAVACRYGGDEFAVAVPGYTQVTAQILADALRHDVSAIAPVLAGRSFPEGTLSISVGVASLPPDDMRPMDDQAAGEALFNLADRALYVAKSGGRNRVAVT